MKKVLAIIVVTTIVPIKTGEAQSRDTANIQVIEELKEEIDSIRTQINLNLDLYDYQTKKDTFKEKPTKE